MSIWTRIGFVYQDSIYCDACAVGKFGSRILEDSPGASQDFEGQSVTPYIAGDASVYAHAQHNQGLDPNVYCGSCRAPVYEVDFGPDDHDEEED